MAADGASEVQQNASSCSETASVVDKLTTHFVAGKKKNLKLIQTDLYASRSVINLKH